MTETMRFAAFRILARGFGVALALTPCAGVAPAGNGFPYNQDLLLDAAPMRPAKRVPIVNVAPDGSATIDLWCKSVPGRVLIEGSNVRIEAAAPPEALPPYMAEGQCTPERMQADYDVLSALVQVTGWQQRGNAVTFDGPAPLRFRISDH